MIYYAITDNGEPVHPAATSRAAKRGATRRGHQRIGVALPQGVYIIAERRAYKWYAVNGGPAKCQPST